MNKFRACLNWTKLPELRPVEDKFFWERLRLKQTYNFPLGMKYENIRKNISSGFFGEWCLLGDNGV